MRICGISGNYIVESERYVAGMNVTRVSGTDHTEMARHGR